MIEAVTCSAPLLYNSVTDNCEECSSAYKLCSECDLRSCVKCRNNAELVDGTCQCVSPYQEVLNSCIQILDEEYSFTIRKEEYAYYQVNTDKNTLLLTLSGAIGYFSHFELPNETKNAGIISGKVLFGRNELINDSKLYISVFGAEETQFNLKFVTCDKVLNPDTEACGECPEVFPKCQECSETSCIECVENSTIISGVCTCDSDTKECSGCLLYTSDAADE